MTDATVPRGAYGLSFPGLEDADALLPALAAWPRVRIERRLGRIERRPRHHGRQRVEIPLVAAGRLVLDRRGPTATFTTGSPLSDDQLVHPYLAPVGAYVGGWLGREAFHAGAFVTGGRAWALLGTREAGKSTTLARLSGGGYPVVTDDILVVDGGCALAGPRCLDLREETVRRLGVAADARCAGRDGRWRFGLADIEPEPPLAGWIFLSWGAGLTMTSLPPAERLVRLARHHTRGASGRRGALLELARLPAWELSRPRDWKLLPDACERMIELASR